MKTYVFSLLAMLFFVCTGNAQTKSESASLKIQTGKTVKEYKYASFADLDAKSDALVSDAARAYAGTIIGGPDDPACQVTVTVTVTVSVGVASVSLSGTVTASCSEISAAVKRLKGQLYAAAMSAID